MYFLPIITLVVSLIIQVGSWQANSANLQGKFDEQKIECERKFERIEKEKADIDIVETKFDNIDWKLNLIMGRMGIEFTPQKLNVGKR